MTDGSERNQSSGVSGTSDGSGATEGAIDQEESDESGATVILLLKYRWIRKQAIDQVRDGSKRNRRSNGSGSNYRSDECYKRWIREQAIDQGA